MRECYLILISAVLVLSEMTDKPQYNQEHEVSYREQNASIFDCGKSVVDLHLPKQSPEISKGRVVDPPYKYPWMVKVMFQDVQHCGAAIITPHFLLTAAHCFSKRKIQMNLDKNNRMCMINNAIQFCNHPFHKYRIAFGGQRQTLHRSRPIKRYIQHPKFDYMTTENDIALIELIEPVQYSKYTRPICLPTKQRVVGGMRLVISGWGKDPDDDAGSHNDHLLQLETTLEVMPYGECLRWTQGKTKVICAKGVLNQGICKGDSGGPLITLDNGVAYILGVASHHYHPECDSRYPQFFVGIQPYLYWIKDNLIIAPISHQNLTFSK